MKLAFALQPFPDELFSSLLARYRKALGLSNYQLAVHILDGHATVSNVTGVAAAASLVRKIPECYGSDVDTFVAAHLLLPYYASVIEEELDWSDGLRAAIKVGCVRKRVSDPPRLRYCMECAEEDKKRYGEEYWHRVHQLPGVVICPDHEIPLTETSVPAKRKNHFETLSGLKRTERTIKVPSECIPLARSLSSDTKWLLHRGRRLPVKDIRAYARKALDVHLWDGISAAARRISDSYSPSLLASVGINTDCRGFLDWFEGLLAPRKILPHPLHLMLIAYHLGFSLREVVDERIRHTDSPESGAHYPLCRMRSICGRRVQPHSHVTGSCLS